MSYNPSRRRLLLAAAVVPFLRSAFADAPGAEAFVARLAGLEKEAGGRLGVSLVDAAGRVRLGYRESERFPFCSTFKPILAGAILARSVGREELLQRRIRYSHEELVHYSPVTERYVEDGMTVAELCAAALQYSDNTAGNLLIRLLGGPGAVTAFARSFGDREFRLDRQEPELNSAVPGDPRDTTTPAAMARSLWALTLGDALPAVQREQLQDWLRGNTTGRKRIRAGVPTGWQVGDKTGSGDYGTANDIAVLWPTPDEPCCLVVYYTAERPGAKWRDDVIATAARIVFGA